MADQPEESQKTEEPSPKKLQDALEKGDVARSQEVRHWFMLTSIVILMVTVGPWSMGRIRLVLGGFIAHSHELPAEGGALLQAVAGLVREVGSALLFPMLILVVGALAGSLIQHKLLFTTEKIKPKLSNISLSAGAKRMFSSRAIMEFAKTLLKFVIVASIGVLIIWPERGLLTQLMTIPAGEMLNVVSNMALRLLIGVVAFMTVVALIDFIYQRAQQTKKLRMTKQEVKDEYKQLEGDPHIKARIRQLRQERARQRMMAAIPESDVVITNPTHYAVALKYDYDTMAVPVVTAKGMDFMARKIRELAEEHDVPLVENPALARVLHATVEIDDEIPPDQYKAVAEVISYILRLQGKMPKPAND
ncbi:MAG: flagellar biosynthesis protein FlhB [Proteobacteria bacterium]|nr:flagellar biosynthesis protein FlhB [Pseudomonadota bacterium]